MATAAHALRTLLLIMANKMMESVRQQIPEFGMVWAFAQHASPCEATSTVPQSMSLV